MAPGLVPAPPTSSYLLASSICGNQCRWEELETRVCGSGRILLGNFSVEPFQSQGLVWLCPCMSECSLVPRLVDKPGNEAYQCVAMLGQGF